MIKREGYILHLSHLYERTCTLNFALFPCTNVHCPINISLQGVQRQPQHDRDSLALRGIGDRRSCSAGESFLCTFFPTPWIYWNNRFSLTPWEHFSQD